jgi:glycine cleavage system H lipoate-binding protein
MVAVLVVVTMLALIALDYFVLRKWREAEGAEDVPVPGLGPMSEVMRRPPAGVFVQPTYTWARIREDGDVLVGVHPMLLGLVGVPFELDLLPSGERIAAGEPLTRVGRAGHRLTIRSPVAGEITEVNHLIVGDAGWESPAAENGSWLYRIRPGQVTDLVDGSMIGERAMAWTREQYDKLRAFLLATAPTREIGMALPDGGEIPVGILSGMDDDVWQAVQREFLGS